MNRIFIYIIICMASIQILKAENNRKVCIDKGWRFHYGAIQDAKNSDFNDSSWRTLDLPHDWSVEAEAAQTAGDNIGPFSPNNPGGSATGQTVGGEGWYRKTFILNEKEKQGRTSLYFEGVYAQSEVWVNGIKVYFNPYGYSSFRFDITDYCHDAGTENVVSVRVVNEGQNTRWYAGSGIYRHVWLIHTPNTHLDDWETLIKTNSLTEDVAEINVNSLVTNTTNTACDQTVRVQIYDADGSVSSTEMQSISIPAHNETAISIPLTIHSPQRWSPEAPYLYTACIELLNGDVTTDKIDINFGLRTLEFNAEQGFLLNGQPVELKGGCIHHDNGLLGAAAYDCAEERKVRLLKNAGYNAIRCSHNIPSEHFLDVCDRLGMLVIDECFDQWHIAKNAQDYAQFFEEYNMRDLRIMLKRDRNHPSIILWSIGNEIPGRADEEGVEIAARFRQEIYRLDGSRGMTAGINDFWDKPTFSWDKDIFRAFQHLDVSGYNYMYHKYESDHAHYPNRVIYGSESYPKQASQNWDLVEKHPYVIGDFVWTALDYLGEAGIAHALYLKNGEGNPQFMGWPWYNGWCGDIDLIGEKKPQSYYRDVIWRERAISMAVEKPIPSGQWQAISGWGWQNEYVSWTFPDCTASDQMTVNVYSRSPKVRLYLNDRLLEEKATSDTYWAGFSVGYQPGTLRAVEWNGQEEGESFSLSTTGEAIGIRLRCERNEMKADGNDLLYVIAEQIDADGNVVTTEDKKIQFSIHGAGTLLAAGNASPNDMESFRSPQPMLFQGRALAILKSNEQTGELTLTAECDGFAPATITFEAVEQLTSVSLMKTEKEYNDSQRFTVYTTHGRIYVPGSTDFKIYSLSGSEINPDRILPAGVYLVQSNGKSQKVLIK